MKENSVDGIVDNGIRKTILNDSEKIGRKTLRIRRIT